MDFTDRQKNAVIIFTIILGGLIALLAFYTNNSFLQSLPPAPSLTAAGARTPDMVRQDVENYKNLVADLKDSHGYLNELLVVKLLKGLFDSLIVAIIAYIFGKPVLLALADRIRAWGEANVKM
jgi:ABC-type glycerol-3-phosphate transport system permease component